MASSRTRLRLHPDREYLSRCASRKQGFDSKSDALTHAEQLMELGRVKAGCHLTPYFCADCHQWHIYNRRIVFGLAVE